VSENVISRAISRVTSRVISRVFPTGRKDWIFPGSLSWHVIDVTYFSAFLPNFDDGWSASGVLLAFLLMAKQDVDQQVPSRTRLFCDLQMLCMSTAAWS
jgi:hypothetical protein